MSVPATMRVLPVLFSSPHLCIFENCSGDMIDIIPMLLFSMVKFWITCMERLVFLPSVIFRTIVQHLMKLNSSSIKALENYRSPPNSSFNSSADDAAMQRRKTNLLSVRHSKVSSHVGLNSELESLMKRVGEIENLMSGKSGEDASVSMSQSCYHKKILNDKKGSASSTCEAILIFEDEPSILEHRRLNPQLNSYVHNHGLVSDPDFPSNEDEKTKDDLRKYCIQMDSIKAVYSTDDKIDEIIRSSLNKGYHRFNDLEEFVCIIQNHKIPWCRVAQWLVKMVEQTWSLELVR